MIKVFNIQGKLLGSIGADRKTSAEKVCELLIGAGFLPKETESRPRQNVDMGLGLIEWRIVKSPSSGKMDFCQYTENSRYRLGRFFMLEYTKKEKQ